MRLNDVLGNMIIKPHETAYEAEPITQPTQPELMGIVKEMANDTASQIANYKKENPNSYIGKLQPNTAVMGYGRNQRDAWSPYDSPLDRPEGYNTLQDFMEDAGLMDWYGDLPYTPNEYNEMSKIFQLAENFEEFERYNNAQKFAQDYRNSQLYGDNYGDALAEMLGNSPQGQTLLDDVRQKMMMANKPISRERNITGSVPEPDWWSAEGLKEEGPVGYRK